MINIFALPLQDNKFYFWHDTNKPLANIIFLIGNQNQDWYDYLTLFKLFELTNTTKRSSN